MINAQSIRAAKEAESPADILKLFADMECPATSEQCEDCPYYSEDDLKNTCPFVKADRFFKEAEEEAETEKLCEDCRFFSCSVQEEPCASCGSDNRADYWKPK